MPSGHRTHGMARREALLFDLVGTLVDEASDYESLDAAMEAARFRFSIQEPASALSGDFSLALMEILREGDDAGAGPGGGPGPEFVPFEEAAKEIFAAVLEVRGIDVSEADVAWFWATFLQVQKRIARLMPDARPALEWARRHGHPIVVITDADPYFVREIMPGLGIVGLWDAIVTAADAGVPKPDPRIFKLALERADVSAHSAIMVGDSYERDVLGARAAGIPRAILVDRHRARTVDEVPVITTLDALPAAVARLAPSMN